jgi:hypothetical protein
MKEVKAMSIEMSTIVKQSKEQVSCSLNEEVAILNLKSTLYFGLDEVGAYIWRAMSEPRSVSELCRQILDHFEIDEPHCHADVLEFLGKLEETGLIEFVQTDALTIG